MSVCTSTIMAAPNPYLILHQLLQLYETPENIEDPDGPKQTDEGAIQKEYFRDYLKSPRTRAVTIYYLQEPGPSRYRLIIGNI